MASLIKLNSNPQVEVDLKIIFFISYSNTLLQPHIMYQGSLYKTFEKDYFSLAIFKIMHLFWMATVIDIDTDEDKTRFCSPEMNLSEQK